MMKKIVLLILVLILSSGCTKPQINDPVLTPESLSYSTTGDLHFCVKDACYLMTHSSYKDSIEGWMSFINEMELEEATLNNQEEMASLTTQENTFVFYQENLIEIDQVVYKISNIEKLKERHSYKFLQLEPNVFHLSDYVTVSSLMEISIGTGYVDTESLVIEFKDNELKKEFVESLSSLIIFDPGFVDWSAGGDICSLKLTNGNIEENNSMTLFLNSERLTTKEASCINGSLRLAVLNLLKKQQVLSEEAEYFEYKEFETDQLKGTLVEVSK